MFAVAWPNALAYVPLYLLSWVSCLAPLWVYISI